MPAPPVRTGIDARGRPRQGTRRHGYSRATDRRSPAQTGPTGRRDPWQPRGLVVFGFAIAALVLVAGLARIRARTEVLTGGRALAGLAAEHSRLQAQKRRLEVERAYLRSPARIRKIATEDLDMGPARPDKLITVGRKTAP